ncbi:MAG TPA: hypothetical protein VMT71_02050 [Syntrophorhabdales bacterium]|nr:hypothetical protein [Syntrophorhabdales bacterium]
MNNILIILALSILAFLGLFVIPVVMTRWASHKVIRIFRQHGAVNAQGARTLADLGLAPLGFFDRLMKPRDYRPQALRFLKERGILHSTADGRFYVSEAGSDQG